MQAAFFRGTDGPRMACSDMLKRAIPNFNKMVEDKAKWQGIDKGRREEERKEKKNVNYFFHNLLVKPHFFLRTQTNLLHYHLVLVKL